MSNQDWKELIEEIRPYICAEHLCTESAGGINPQWFRHMSDKDGPDGKARGFPKSRAWATAVEIEYRFGAIVDAVRDERSRIFQSE